MEQFTVHVKNLITNKIKKVEARCMDHYLAHKTVFENINMFKEEIVSIKDSKKNEVFNLDQGFIFEN